MDKAHDPTTGQKHIHINGPKDQSWSQNEDGSPHDKGNNSPGDPPNSMKKEVKKRTGWDWDAKAKSYAEKFEEGQVYYDLDFGQYYWVNNGQMYYSPTNPIEDPLGLRGKGSGGKVRLRLPRMVLP